MTIKERIALEREAAEGNFHANCPKAAVKNHALADQLARLLTLVESVQNMSGNAEVVSASTTYVDGRDMGRVCDALAAMEAAGDIEP